MRALALHRLADATYDSEHDDYVSVINAGGEDVLVVALKASRPTLNSMEWRKAAAFRPDLDDPGLQLGGNLKAD